MNVQYRAALKQKPKPLRQTNQQLFVDIKNTKNLFKNNISQPNKCEKLN